MKSKIKNKDDEIVTREILDEVLDKKFEEMLKAVINGQHALRTEFGEMLKAVINGQHALRTEFNSRFAESDKKIEALRKELRKEMKDGFDAVNERLDKQGKQLAYLEDDTPTREEFDDLKKRVEKLEVN